MREIHQNLPSKPLYFSVHFLYNIRENCGRPQRNHEKEHRTMIRIGFADYYLGEWHADNYPGWMREICAEMGDEIELAYAWAEDDVSPRNGKRTTEIAQSHYPGELTGIVKDMDICTVELSERAQVKGKRTWAGLIA